MREDDTFGPATPVAELNSSIYESGPVVRRDGLEVIFQSSRPRVGSVPGYPSTSGWPPGRAQQMSGRSRLSSPAWATRHGLVLAASPSRSMAASSTSRPTSRPPVPGL